MVQYFAMASCATKWYRRYWKVQYFPYFSVNKYYSLLLFSDYLFSYFFLKIFHNARDDIMISWYTLWYPYRSVLHKIWILIFFSMGKALYSAKIFIISLLNSFAQFSNKIIHFCAFSYKIIHFLNMVNFWNFYIF